ncbi:hypothetical protein P9209_03410 [Prescottella defluvii]|nr:hypothetical protein P9209_03410 [Prescottella defluvii]
MTEQRKDHPATAPLNHEELRQFAMATVAHAARARQVQQCAGAQTTQTAAAEFAALDDTINLVLRSYVQPRVFVREVLTVVLDRCPELVDRLDDLLDETLIHADVTGQWP